MRLRRLGDATRAVLWLALIELSLRGTDLPTTCRRLGVACDLDSAAPPAGRVAVLPVRARRTYRVSLAVASRWPWGDTCLRRCLLVGRVLRRSGPVLRIGVGRDRRGAFAAHSWLEIGGATLDPAAAGFAPLGAVGR